MKQKLVKFSTDICDGECRSPRLEAMLSEGWVITQIESIRAGEEIVIIALIEKED